MTVTFLYVTHPEWDFNIKRAATTVALGFCHGFDELGHNWGLASEPCLEQTLDSVENPIVMLGYDNYTRLPESTLHKLHSIPHFIWVNVWFDGARQFSEQHGHLNPVLPVEQLQKILDPRATFLMSSATESYFDYWENWIKAGQRVESIPEACDTTEYYPRTGAKLKGLDVVFVGGYREYKEEVYEKFLWPYENDLTIYGYNEWPKCYAGYLENDREAKVYQSAKVVPAIGEPFAWATGTFYERPFKVLGSGGLTITDTSPAYRELFDEDELLVPDTVAEYYDMMHLALTDAKWNQQWRKKGLRAVLKKHTYRNRAEKILRLLGVE